MLLHTWAKGAGRQPDVGKRRQQRRPAATMPQCCVIEADKDVKANIDKVMASQPNLKNVKIEWAPCTNPGFENCPAVPPLDKNAIKN